MDALLSGYNLDDPIERKEADEDIKKLFKDPGGMDETQNYTAEMAEKMFLKTMNSTAFGSGNSISLYQYENKKWKKLILDLNGNMLREPCPYKF